MSIREQVYNDQRPKEFFDRYHERSRTREPDWVYDVVRIVTSLYAWSFFRTRGISVEKVPDEGPVILAPNHFSFMDHFFVGAPIRRRVRFMAKSQLFRPPMQWIYSHGGVFPVRRGAGDEEAFVTANTILARGGAIVMYCEGGRSRSGRLGERARRGIGRLALESGATVVPIAIHGSSQVRNWKRLRFPKVTIQYGDPIRWEKRWRAHAPSAAGGGRHHVLGDPGALRGPGGAGPRGRAAPRSRAAPRRAAAGRPPERRGWRTAAPGITRP